MIAAIRGPYCAWPALASGEHPVDDCARRTGHGWERLGLANE